MNLSVLLVCFTFFSFIVSLSSDTDAIFIAPVIFLAVLNFKNLFEILKFFEDERERFETDRRAL